jgi:DNA-directed RNA polymerase subunit RPC12/RpoP
VEDGAGFWLYRCQRCESQVRTRQKVRALARLCVKCFRPEDAKKRLPPDLPPLYVGYEYVCGSCGATVRGTWTREADEDGSIGERIRARVCQDCYREARRRPPPEKSSEASNTDDARRRRLKRPVRSGICLHGSPAQVCAYCNPGKYPWRSWMRRGRRG